MNCIFCDIVSKTSPASIIYEDDTCLAFLDIYPVNEGHAIVIPKHHCSDLQECPPQTAQHLIAVVQKINAAIMKAAGCNGVINEIRNGLEADQEIMHFNVHAVPRKLNDGFGWFFPPGYRERPIEREKLDRLAEAVRQNLKA